MRHRHLLGVVPLAIKIGEPHLIVGVLPGLRLEPENGHHVVIGAVIKQWQEAHRVILADELDAHLARRGLLVDHGIDLRAHLADHLGGIDRIVDDEGEPVRLGVEDVRRGRERW